MAALADDPLASSSDLPPSQSGDANPAYFTIGSSSSSSFTASTERDASEEDDCRMVLPDDDDIDDDEIIILDHKSSSSSASSPLTLDDFDLLSTVGKGGFGRVFLVQAKASVANKRVANLDPGSCYALKSIRKSRLAVNRTELKHTLSEHRALQTAGDHPFVVKLVSTFQSRSRIFFLTEFLPGGELFGLLTQRDSLPEEDAKFYLAELVLALDFLHSRNIIYRDLKPENVMINSDGHVKLIDFGLARDDLTTEEPMTMTYCGTKEYMAPEVHKRQPYNRSADWWSLGAVAYDMIAGEFPYVAGDYDTPVTYPDKFSMRAKRFVRKLLKVDPEERLGNPNVGGVQSIKKSSFFVGVSWNDVFRKRMRPPFVPRLEAANSVRYFDKDFLRIPAKLSTSSKDGGDDDFGYFKDFAYVHPEHRG